MYLPKNEPYEGNEPYIFVNYGVKGGPHLVSLVQTLNDMGYHVSFDTDIQRAVLWTDRRSGLIEKCALFIDLISGDGLSWYFNSPGYYYANSMNKVDIVINAASKDKEALSEYFNVITASPDSEAFRGYLEELLKRIGFYPGITWEEWNASGNKNDITITRPGPFDLGLSYYKEVGDRNRIMPHTRKIDVNLRTRKAFDYENYELPSPSDKELFEAIQYKTDEFYRAARTKDPDYVMTDFDRAFKSEFLDEHSWVLEKIDAEAKADKKRLEECLRNIPYRDEFEYIDAKIAGEI